MEKFAGIGLVLALAIIAVLVVPIGSISLSISKSGGVREEVSKAVSTQQVQQLPREAGGS
jgi:preprotein translocase subunit SecF